MWLEFQPDALSVGDVVRLRSGGPAMTAEVVGDVNGWIGVVWFVDNTVHRTQVLANDLVLRHEGVAVDEPGSLTATEAAAVAATRPRSHG